HIPPHGAAVPITVQRLHLHTTELFRARPPVHTVAHPQQNVRNMHNDPARVGPLPDRLSRGSRARLRWKHTSYTGRVRRIRFCIFRAEARRYAGEAIRRNPAHRRCATSTWETV